MASKVYVDIEAARKLINGDYVLINRQKYGPVYPWSNEDINFYMSYGDFNNKSVLSITSSFDQALHVIYRGASSVDCFDKNRLCKYYADLKRALILGYDEERFKRIIEFGTVNTRFLRRIKDDFILPGSYTFWSTILKESDVDSIQRLFRIDGPPRYNLPSCSELKKKVEGIPITFYDFKLKDLDRYLDQGKTYDIILLSNILDFSEDDSDFYKALSRLNDNGLLYDYHINKKNRKYPDKPIETISCPNSNHLCKIYTK